MMGPKTLGEIREDLKASFAKMGQDPIQWLENRLKQLEKRPKSNQTEIDLLEGLRRFLHEGPKKAKRTSGRTRARSTQ
jgi:hypothetical protein